MRLQLLLEIIVYGQCYDHGFLLSACSHISNNTSVDTPVVCLLAASTVLYRGGVVCSQLYIYNGQFFYLLPRGPKFSVVSRDKASQVSNTSLPATPVLFALATLSIGYEVVIKLNRNFGF